MDGGITRVYLTDTAEGGQMMFWRKHRKPKEERESIITQHHMDEAIESFLSPIVDYSANKLFYGNWGPVIVRDKWQKPSGSGEIIGRVEDGRPLFNGEFFVVLQTSIVTEHIMPPAIPTVWVLFRNLESQVIGCNLPLRNYETFLEAEDYEEFRGVALRILSLRDRLCRIREESMKLLREDK